MLGTVLSSILMTKFGSFIDGLDPKNVTINIWNGRISYTNLLLKPEYCNNLIANKCQMQAELKFGQVGMFEINFPWSVLCAFSGINTLKGTPMPVNASTTECIIIVRDVKILVANSDSYSNESKPEMTSMEDLSALEREEKIQEILCDLIRRNASSEWSPTNPSVLQQQKHQSKSESEQSSWKETYLNRLLTNIFSTLRVRVERVHIRYQFESPYDNNIFAAGLTFDAFNVSSSNAGQFATEQINFSQGENKCPYGDICQGKSGVTSSQVSTDLNLEGSPSTIPVYLHDQLDVSPSAVDNQHQHEEKIISNDSGPTICKEAVLENLSVYWDTIIDKNTDLHWMDSHLVSDMQYYQKRFDISSKDYMHDHHFLLSPTSLLLTLSFRDPFRAIPPLAVSSPTIPQKNFDTKDNSFSSDEQIDINHNSVPSNSRDGLYAVDSTSFGQGDSNSRCSESLTSSNCNKILFSMSLCRICFNRGMIEDFGAFRRYNQRSVLKKQQKDEGWNTTCEHFNNPRRHQCLPLQFLEFWYRPCPVQLGVSREKVWFWIESLVLRNARNVSRSIDSSQKTFWVSRCKNWYILTLLLRARQTYGNIFLNLRSLEESDKSGILLSLEGKRRDLALIELSLCLSLEEVALWRLHAINSLAPNTYPEKTRIYEWGMSSRRLVTDFISKLSKFSPRPTSLDAVSTAKPNEFDGEASNRFDVTPSLGLEHIVTALVAEEKLASSLSSKYTISSTDRAFRSSVVGNLLKSAAWTMAAKLSSLQIQCNDTIALTQISSLSRATTQIPIFKFECSSQIDLLILKNGSQDVTITLSALEVQDLTSVLTSGSTVVHPLLFGLSKKETKNSIDATHKGVHFCVTKRADKKRKNIITILVRVSPMEFHYRSSALEALSRILSTASAQSDELRSDDRRASVAMRNFSLRQKDRIKKILFNEDCDLTMESSCPQNDNDNEQVEFIVDVEVLSPLLKFSELSTTAAHCDTTIRLSDDSISLSFDRLRICNIKTNEADSADVLSGAKSRRTWEVHITALWLKSCGVFVLSPLSLKSILSITPLQFGSAQLSVELELPTINLYISTSFKRLLSRLAEEWISRRRYWALQQRTQKRAEKWKSKTYVSPCSSPTRPATLSVSHRQNGNLITFRASCVVREISLHLVNDIDYTGIYTPNEPVPILRIMANYMKLNFHRFLSQQLCLKCAFDDVLIEDLYSGWYSSSISEAKPQLSRNALLSSRQLDAEGSMPTAEGAKNDFNPDPFLILEYNTSESMENANLISSSTAEIFLSVTVAKALYIDWNPETIAAAQWALRLTGMRSVNDQTLERWVGVESEAVGEAKIKSDEGKDISEETDFFFDAVDYLEDSLSSFCDNVISSPLDEPVRSSDAATCNLTPKLLGFDESPLLDQRTSTTTICVKSLKTFINFLKPPNEFVPHVDKLFCASTDSILLTYRSATNSGITISCELHNFVLWDGNNISSYGRKSRNRCRKPVGAGDPAAPHRYTLYGEFLDTRLPNEPNDPHRVFAFHYESFPRKEDRTASDFVSISKSQNEDVSNYAIYGQDSSLSVRLPKYTKLVFIQQLWLEVIDYFFEGIMGSEVLHGKLREQPLDPWMAVSEESLRLPSNLSFSSMTFNAPDACVIIPVTYCSPEYIKLALSLSASNYFDGKMCEDESHSSLPWMQWFNNLKLSCSGVRICNWREQQISTTLLGSEGESVQLEVSVRWPTGPTAPLIIPKWDVLTKLSSLSGISSHNQMPDAILFTLSQDDYALFQNILSYNFCEDSRNYQSWRAWKLAERDRLVISHFESIRLVNFGYDVKDGFPSTFAFKLRAPTVILELVKKSESSDGKEYRERTALRSEKIRVNCEGLVFSIEKVADWVSRQRVSLDSVHLMTSLCDASYRKTSRNMNGMIDLIVPNIDTADECVCRLVQQPLLVYSSTSNPHADNVKTLSLSSNSIVDFSNPTCWLSLRDFFSNLPPPSLWTPAEVLGSMRIGDRWYSIDHAAKVPCNVGALDIAASEKVLNDKCQISRCDQIKDNRTLNYQFRLVLDSPHIMLGTISNIGGLHVHQNVVLRCALDYLYTLQTTDSTSGRQTNSSVLLSNVSHDIFVEKFQVFSNVRFGLCNSSLPLSPLNMASSLIDPINFAFGIKCCTSPYKCVTSLAFNSGFFRLKLRFSDLITLLDVGSQTMENIKASSSEEVTDRYQDQLCRNVEIGVEANVEGFSSFVIDDSGRHFADSRELFRLSFGSMYFSFKKCHRPKTEKKSCLYAPEDDAVVEDIKDASFLLQSLHVTDLLQPIESSFHLVATSTATAEALLSGLSLVPPQEKATVKPKEENAIMFSEFLGGWGFAATDVNDFIGELPPNEKNFIEVRHNVCSAGFLNFDAIVGSFIVQWNPGTVIAVQRFLGRAFKEYTKRFQSKILTESETFYCDSGAFGEKGTILHHDSLTRSESRPTSTRPLKASLRLETLSIILNKEHQERHLLNICVSGLNIQCELGSLGKTEIVGSLADLSAVDLQHYSPPPSRFVCTENLSMLSVHWPIDSSTEVKRNFVTFHFRKMKAPEKVDPFCNADRTSSLTEAVLPSWVLQSNSPVDDYLSVNMSSLMFVNISERTAELVDYLSNGLPGRGMGRTAAAAKGFFGARIKTRSVMSISVEAPVIMIPRHIFSDSFVKVRLGDVRLKSWFEERTFTSALLSGVLADEIQPCEASSRPVQSEFLQSPKLKTPAISNAMPTEPLGHKQDSELSDWWRCLSVCIVNMGFSTSSCKDDNMQDILQPQCPPCLYVILRKPLWYNSTVVIRSSLSFINARLSYSDWALTWLVYQENLGKKVDSRKWDTVLEEDAYLGVGQDVAENEKNNFVYSEDARIIRYGIKKDKPLDNLDVEIPTHVGSDDGAPPSDDAMPNLDLKLELEGLNLTLFRDDTLMAAPMLSQAIFHYDSSRIRMKRVEVEVVLSAKGDQQVIMSLFKLDWIDLGNIERLRRQEIQGVSEAVIPSAFTAIVEGSIRENGPSLDVKAASPFASSHSRDSVTPQLAVSFIKPACGIPVASIVINHLTINALVKPIVETFEFLSCAWPTPHLESSNEIFAPFEPSVGTVVDDGGVAVDDANKKATNNVTAETKKSDPDCQRAVGGFSLKLVAHYPHIFLLADEADPLSRALVFRGLAVLEYSTLRENATASFLLQSRKSQLNSLTSVPDLRDIKTTTSLTAELHSMESYINPNVSEVLLCNQNALGRNLFPQLGIALIEPVTASFSVSQTFQDLFPTTRIAKLEIESLSTILSFGDMDLIERVLKRWLGERERFSKEYQTTQVDNGEHAVLIDPQSSRANILPNTGDSFPQPVIPENPTDVSCKNEYIPDQSNWQDAFIDIASQSRSFYTYTVTFNTEKLGLVLRKERKSIVVEEVRLTDTTSRIRVGDILVAIGDARISPKDPFKMVAKNLEISPRPIKLTFLRVNEVLVANAASQREAENMPRPDETDSVCHPVCNTSSLHRNSLRKERLKSSSFLLNSSEGNAVSVSSFSSNAVSSELAAAMKPIPAPPLRLVETYSIVFLAGEPNGLRFEQGLGGSVSIVVGIDCEMYASATNCLQNPCYNASETWGWKAVRDEENNSCLNVTVRRKQSCMNSDRMLEVEATLLPSEPIRLPRPGAVVLSVNGVETSGQDFATVMDKIHTKMAAEDKNGPLTYTVTFAEIPASEWTTLDQIALAVKGVALTVIDDINGRDMPLIRGTMESLQFCFDQGFGLPTQMIAVGPPAILKLECSTTSSDDISDDICHSQHANVSPSRRKDKEQSTLLVKRSDASEVIMKVGVESFLGIEYYNPRLAVWEPLLEPCRLRFAIERQSGNGKVDPPRPGHIAILLTNGENSINGKDRYCQSNSIADAVCFNLTDAAAEVLITAAGEWRHWRASSGTTDSSQTVNANNAIADVTGNNSIGIAPSFAENKILSLRSISDGIKTPTFTSNRKKAAQEAAMVAVNVAKKRDDEASGGVAKPFILRNRTGVAIAFVCQNLSRVSGVESKIVDAIKFRGLENFEPSSIRVVENNDDFRFNIDAIDLTTAQRGSVNSSLVRAYGDANPFLSISIDPSIGISDLLMDLPVMKVGQFFRRLKMHNVEAGNDQPILRWSVEIDNNRRLLTLSGSIMVESVISGVPIEVGVKATSVNPNAVEIKRGVSCAMSDKVCDNVVSVGVARPGLPCFLPIWLYRCQAVTVHVRPLINQALSCSDGEESPFMWSTKHVLEYVKENRKAIVDKANALQQKVTGWRWQHSGPPLLAESEAKSVSCRPRCSSMLSAFLYYYIDAYEPGKSASVSASKMSKSFTKDDIEGVASMISVSIGSTLTIRNLLPVEVEWEVAGSALSVGKMQRNILLDSSASRRRRKNRDGGTLRGDPPIELDSLNFDIDWGATDQFRLESGQAVEVLSCDSQNMLPKARFLCQGCDGNWTEWAELSLCNEFAEKKLRSKAQDRCSDGHLGRDVNNDFPSFPARQCGIQTTIQCIDGSGTPLNIGLRLQAKNSLVHRSETRNDSFGLEVTLFAELWIKNLTSLPLVFGAPASQVKSTRGFGRNKSKLGSSGKLMAEVAVLEIASVLDFGEFGRDLNLDDDLKATVGDILILPKQQAQVVVEEVFEYIEVESSCVRRRWWASEKHDEFRHPPECIEVPDQSEWHWDGFEDSATCGWRIDCSGGVIRDAGGWESCRNLVGGSSFHGKRFFDSSQPYRRRRFFRRRFLICTDVEKEENVMFYQPYLPPVNELVNQRDFDNFQSFLGSSSQETIGMLPRIALKCGDGRWSSSILIPPRGISNGLLRVAAARWPQLCSAEAKKSDLAAKASGKPAFEKSDDIQSESGFIYETACLNPTLYELCYQISTLGGTWGEYSRILTVSPRYMIRNDSDIFSMDVKQTGSSDDTVVRVGVGEVVPFYWSDYRLPELICIRPVLGNGQRQSEHISFCDSWEFTDYFKWSGGIDLCDLRMSAIRIRKNPCPNSPFPRAQGTATSADSSRNDSKRHAICLRTIRAQVEIRPGTGGTGITFSLKDEDFRGEGSLFRIENLTPFPIWIAQDGILNPGYGARTDPGVSGDLILPREKLAFGLDAPFRQGKHGRVVPYHELHLIRVTLAPLNSRDGVECTKVIGLTSLGSSVRLGPSKLRNILDEDTITQLLGVRLLGVVCSDGPTRVLRFCLMQKEVSAGNVFGDAMRRQFFDPPRIVIRDLNDETEARTLIQNAAVQAILMMRSGKLPSALDAEHRAFYNDFSPADQFHAAKFSSEVLPFSDIDVAVKSESIAEPSGISTTPKEPDLIFSFEASLKGFLVSLVDSEPSEIAVVMLRSVEVLAKWNRLRTKDAVAAINVGWLQVDNHCPGAPYPVAVCPDGRDKEQVGDESDAKQIDRPFLSLKLAFAPQHSSGIACLRSATVSPRDLNIAVDLAFIARLQRFLLELQEHIERALAFDKASACESGHLWSYSEMKEKWPFPQVIPLFKKLDGVSVAGTGGGTDEYYFEGLMVEPCHLSLSIAPARTLTAAEATKEGAEAAAIHAAVRKGDLLISGEGEGVLGVKVGGRNKTAIQVVRGMFKNILFDALLRCDSAVMDFPGVLLRNHITSKSQLSTYMLAHYVTALRNNLPALLGSLAAFGNPVGLIRDLGDGVSDFVSEPIKGFKKSLQELDPIYVVDGVAKGTGSLARHAVGGFADSASMLTETLSKNMAVLTLDRRYAQQRDRSQEGRSEGGFVEGIGSGGIKIVKGVVDGVTGVVRQPIRGAERSGVEGFTKGLGKGLIGLVVKPVIGLSDAATDVMIGVKGSIEKGVGEKEKTLQIRPRRALYGDDRAIRVYDLDDARASAIMNKTKDAAADQYMNHINLGDLVVILSTKRLIVLTGQGRLKQVVKYTKIEEVEIKSESVRSEQTWVVALNIPNNTMEPIICQDYSSALELCRLIKKGMELDATRRRLQKNVEQFL